MGVLQISIDEFAAYYVEKKAAGAKLPEAAGASFTSNYVAVAAIETMLDEDAPPLPPLAPASAPAVAPISVSAPAPVGGELQVISDRVKKFFAPSAAPAVAAPATEYNLNA